MPGAKSEELWERAQKTLVGGVNSPVRAFRSVGGTPPFIASAKAATIQDEDGKQYTDYVGSWGPMIAGHAHPKVLQALQEALERGTSYGAPTSREIDLAEIVVERVPGVEKVRFVNSGTEAGMSVMRLARAATGRTRLIKFAGNYHGHSDGLLVRAGSGVATLGLPDSPGVPSALAEMTVVAQYNDPTSVQEILERYPGEVAAILVEPVAGNMGVVPPAEGFLNALRELCDAHGCLLVFDEVMTGFRVDFGGAAARYGVTPDLYCFGKVIGGGLPVGAYAGPARLMDQVAPSGPVYQAGTLSGNPLAMAAGIATLELLEPSAYDQMESLGQQLQEGLEQAISSAGVSACVQRVGSMLTLFFQDGPVRFYEEALRSKTEQFALFHRSMLEQGQYLPPSQYEGWFLSLAHSQETIEQTLHAARKALQKVAAES